MSSTDLQNDLLADLRSATYSAPVPPLPPGTAGTPTLDLRVTPLRWSRVRLSLGTGLALHAGPVQVRVTR
jgi:hypothetical protein